MLEQTLFALEDPQTLRELIERHPWATLVSSVDGEMVVSHLPIVLQPPGVGDGNGSPHPASIVGHLAKADAELHELGRHPVVLIVQGPHGYLSPSWYRYGPHVPTWNFIVLHLHGLPTVLSAQETWQVLSSTVDHLESGQSQPWRLDSVADYANGLLPAVTGFVLDPQRAVGKAKLSQDQRADEMVRLADALDGSTARSPGPSDLAHAMRSTNRES